MEKIRSRTRIEYISRINRALDYINGNLENELDLTKIAEVANFSKFHFHRIFAAFIGETLNGYIRRKRVELAASILSENRHSSIADVAYKCGFSSPAVFSRSFKEHFNMSATEFADGGYIELRKIRKENSNHSKRHNFPDDYFCNVVDYHDNERRIEMEKVEIKDLPDLTVAYIRHTGNYSKIGDAFEKLGKWAIPRDLLTFPETKFLAVYHDSPDVTEEEKLRSDACVIIPPDMEVSGEVGKTVVKGGKYAMCRFEIQMDGFTNAWEEVIRGWLPDSGFVCDDKPMFELYLNNPEEHPEHKIILDICVPVKPMD